MRARVLWGFGVSLLLVVGVWSGVSAAKSTTYVVTTLDDHAAGACDSECTLREAVNAANGNPGSTISFSPGLTGTIAVGGGGTDLVINAAVDIQGPGADKITVQAATFSRIFTIGYLSGAARSVGISGLTLTGGNSAEAQGGGAIK